MEPVPRQTATELTRLKPSRTVRNIFSNWLGFIVTAIVAFFLSPFIVRHLGDSGYGIWTLTMSLTGYLGLLDLGVRGAVTRYVAKFHAQAADEDASRVVSSGLTIFLAAGAIAILVAVGIALLAVGHLKIPDSYRVVARVVLILTGLNIAVSLISGVFGGVVAALQRFDLQNALEIGNAVSRTTAIVFVLSYGGGLISFAVIQLAFAILLGAANVVLAFHLYPQLRIHFSAGDKENLKLIFSFSFYSFFLRISSYLVFYTDSVVIGTFLPVSMVTFFAIAGNLMNYSRELLSGISTASGPLATVLETSGEEEELRRVLLKGSRFASMVFFPIGICFLIRGSSFIGLWMGPSYASLSGKVLMILAVALFFASGNQVTTNMTISIGRHKGMVPAFLFEGLWNLGLSMVLVRFYGIVGVALGTTLPNLATQLLFWPWYIHRVYKIHPLTYVFSTWVRPGLAVVPYTICTYVIEKRWPATNLLIFFVQVAFALPTAGIAFWFLCTTPEERKNYSERFIRPLLRAFGGA